MLWRDWHIVDGADNRDEWESQRGEHAVRHFGEDAKMGNAKTSKWVEERGKMTEIKKAALFTRNGLFFEFIKNLMCFNLRA